MAKYQYSALKNNNEIVKGEIDASNLKEARQKIIALGFIPTKVYMEDNADNTDYSGIYSKYSSPVKNISFLSLQDKILFTSELEVLLSAGIPIIEALQTIESNSPKKKLVEICSNLKNSIVQGKTFARALEYLYGDVFGQVYTAIVKTGENAGELEAALTRILTLLRKQDRIKSKIINASIYPAILLLIMSGVLVLFTKVVFPAFYSLISGSGGNIPFTAQILINFCSFVDNFWWFLIIAAVGICYGLISLFKNVQFKNKWDEFILKVPVISDFIRYINLANFMTVLYISYDAGLPIMAGLELSNKTVGNYVIKHKIYNSINLIRAGKTLTEAFQRTDAIPGAIMTMIAAGEKSGALGKMMHDAAEVLDKKIDMALEALTKLFEPAVIIIIGCAVLFVAVAFYQLYAGMLGSLF